MRRSPSPRVLALSAALVVLGLAAIAVLIPYVTRDREAVAGVPVPPPYEVAENIRLAPDQQVCLKGVAIDVDSDIAEFSVASNARSGPPLGVSVTAAGYRAGGEVAGGYTSPGALRVPLRPPSHSLLADFCIENRGKRRVQLLAAHEGRTASRPVAFVDGAEVPQDLALRFLSRDSGSVLSRLGSLIDRMSAFHPPVLEKPVLWLLLVLLVFVLPAAAIYAIASSFRSEA
jgi:hypothetical protein